MISPAPTSKIDPTLARALLAETVPATATKPAYIVLTFPNTSYEMHLLPTSPVTTPVGKRCLGTITARALRVDTVETGGRYVEPVLGRPRRVQGSVIAIDEKANAIIVDAGMPIRCILTDPRQCAAAFEPGQFVSFDVLDGATFTPAA